MKEHNPWCQKC